MEYVQMTINDWLELKNKLKLELQGVKHSFVRIGYTLRRIDDNKLYEQDGYKSIAEFAKAEYGLEASTVSRFMSINREYSVDGYSEQLREEYLEMGRSQLEEMLKLPESDREMIQPEASREDIRELKRFNKADPEEGVADDIRELIIAFYKANAEVLNAIYSGPTNIVEVITFNRMKEIVNPGGNRSFKKGLFFMMMYEDSIKIKKFGSEPQTMSWEEFFKITFSIFESKANGAYTYKNYFGVDDEPKKEEPDESVQIKSTDAIKEKSLKKSIGQSESVTFQKPTEKETKEVVAPAKNEVVETAGVAEVLYKSRKEYLDSLSINEAATYIAEEYKCHNLMASSLGFPSELESWLSKPVNIDGIEL